MLLLAIWRWCWPERVKQLAVARARHTVAPARERANANAHARSRASTERETRDRDASPRGARVGRGGWSPLVLCESLVARRLVRVVDDRVVREYDLVVRESFASR